MDMFFDGVIYASIAQNMALGKGGFWHPYYTEQFLNPFYEHPPLAMWLQSIAFKIFGTSWRIEFVWGAVCGFITLIFTKKIYEEFNTEPNSNNKSWWPIFLFISIPTVTWTFANGLLESTMIVFTTGSVFLTIKALKVKNQTHIYFYSASAGFLIFAGFMTKGLPALFPLAIPFIWLFIYFKDKTQTKNSLMCFARMFLYMFFAVVILNVLSSGELFKFFSIYVNEQIIKSIKGQREEVKHFYLAYRFAGEIVVPVFIVGVAYIVLRIKKTVLPAKLNDQNKIALLFLLIALSASLPIFFVPKQRIWYLFPSLVFYSMAIAKFSENLIVGIKPYQFLKYLSVVLLICGLTVITIFGGARFRRDKEFYKDIILQKELIPKRAIIYACPEKLAKNWETNAFMQRFCLASLTDDEKTSTGLMLVDKTKKELCHIQGSKTLINKNPLRYELYK